MKKPRICRICTYFIIYSVLGFILETTFAFIAYHVIESRKSFLYGPFCSIYGVGATLMILALEKYRNNNAKLFFGGILVGTIAEYTISLVGEKVFGMRFWDYSNEFLNIDGRICLGFSVVWGLAGFVLIKKINPFIDRYIDNFCKDSKRTRIFEFMVWILMIFIIIDCVITYISINFFLAKSAKKHNLELANEYEIEMVCNIIENHPVLKEKISKIATPQRIILALPNLETTLKDGSKIKLQELTPEVRNCHYRFVES